MRLLNQVAIITGASGGIGRVLARAFAEEGADVVLVGRRPEPLAQTADQLDKLGPRTLVVPTDVTNEADVREMVATAMRQLGRVDILVHAAATPGKDMSVANMTLENWNATIDTSLTGAMLCSRECLTQSMLPRRAGSILYVSAASARFGLARKSHFCVAKAGLLRLAESLAREVGPQGVRVNAILPGAVATELLERYYQRSAAERGLAYERVVEEATRNIALRRLVDPNEVASLAVFLASDQASGITGQSIDVNGGA